MSPFHAAGGDERTLLDHGLIQRIHVGSLDEFGPVLLEGCQSISNAAISPLGGQSDDIEKQKERT